MKPKRVLKYLNITLAVFVPAFKLPAQSIIEMTKIAKKHLIKEIRTQTGYRQIRAAEMLADCAEMVPVNSQDMSVKIGQYRVKIAAGELRFISFVVKTALKPQMAGHAHALEAVAKLKLHLYPKQLKTIRRIARRHPVFPSSYALWILAEHGDKKANKLITAAIMKHVNGCIYASGFLEFFPVEREKALKRCLKFPGLTGTLALWALARHRKIAAPYILGALKRSRQEKTLRFCLLALGETGSIKDIAILFPYLRHTEPECRNAAAGAIMKIYQRLLRNNKLIRETITLK